MTDYRIPPYIRWLFFGGIGLILITNLMMMAAILLLNMRFGSLEVHYTPLTHYVFLALFAVGLFALIVGGIGYAEWDARFNYILLMVICVLLTVGSTISLSVIPKIPNAIFGGTKAKEVWHDGRVHYLFGYASGYHHNHNYINFDGNHGSGYSYDYILYECDNLHLFCVVKERPEASNSF